jgi:PEGA domain
VATASDGRSCATMPHVGFPPMPARSEATQNRKSETMTKFVLVLLGFPVALAIIAMNVPPTFGQEKLTGNDQELISRGQASYTSIVSSPPGAQVLVDGQFAGTTGSIPVTFLLIRHGDTPRIITIRRDGYKPYEQQIVPVGTPILITATLEADGSGVSVRRLAAGFLNDSFRKTIADAIITTSDPDGTTIAVTSKMIFKDKNTRAAFRDQVPSLTKGLCLLGFAKLVLTESDSSGANKDEFDLVCPAKTDQTSVESTRLETATQQHAPTGVGRIKGTLTFYFNANYGARPDTGSGAWLVKGRLEISSSAFFEGLDDLVIIDKAHFQHVLHTIADGNGNFDLDEVPAGEYTLIIQSAHRIGATSRDIGGKVMTFPILLTAGQVIEKSWDFGLGY